MVLGFWFSGFMFFLSLGFPGFRVVGLGLGAYVCIRNLRVSHLKP